jgi:AraC family transcriptional regulator
METVPSKLILPWAARRSWLAKSAGLIKSRHAGMAPSQQGQHEDAMAENWTNYEDRLNRVTAYIYDHLDDALDFQTLAEVAALSPYHWHRIYHAVRGETAVATAKRLRLQRAAVDLAQTGMTIEAVAARAGYSGVQAFTRAFSEAYGLPPARYRADGSHADFKPGQLEAPRANWRIEIRQTPPLLLLTVEHIGSYMEIGRAFETLFGRATALGLLTPETRMIGVYCDDPTAVPEDKLRSHAAIVAPPDAETIAPLRRLETRGGEYAILRHKGPYADMRSAYLWLFGTWLPQSGREAADAPVIEEYLNNPRDTPPSELLTELLLPLR